MGSPSGSGPTFPRTLADEEGRGAGLAPTEELSPLQDTAAAARHRSHTSFGIAPERA